MYTKYLNEYHKETYCQLNTKLNKDKDRDIIALIEELKDDGICIRSLILGLLRDYGRTYHQQKEQFIKAGK